jgi:hypothetical protein
MKNDINKYIKKNKKVNNNNWRFQNNKIIK